MVALNKRAGFTLLAIVIAGALALLFIVASLLPKCEPTKEKPFTDLAKVKLWRDHSAKALIRVAGYLKYQTNSTTDVYLPLDFHQVYVNVNNMKMIIAVNMNSKCANIQMTYHQSNMITTVNRALIVFGISGVGHEECIVDYPRGIYFPSGRHYKCSDTRRYDCFANKLAFPTEMPPIVASLYLDLLEFEVGGDSSQFGAGLFTKPALDRCPI